ncbi:MAG: acyltransferase [Thermoanaerobaculia bacterium]|jgi:1-acyl-sn-glycerol-3-phosphate acyltransferase|nr:acyltransferase [Thermoanaerobaculia bacterium]
MPFSPASALSAGRLVTGSATFLLFALNTFFWCALLYLVTLLKLVVPIAAFRRAASRLLVAIGEAWIAVNTVSLKLTQPTVYDVTGLEGLRRNVSYLVVSNHQSWVDIPVLQGVFLRRIPFLRFFLKQQLIRVPFLGAAWWALDFPFMKRHSREALERNPDLRHEDLEATRRACERFRHAPAAILNFVEGTRFTPAKHARGGSPFRHLLVPKAGGLAFAASAMGPQLAGIVDVTIVYPHGSPTFWDLISRGLPEVVVRVQERAIPGGWFEGDYTEDAAFRGSVQAWVRDLFLEKDAEIDALLASRREPAEPGRAPDGRLG